MSVRTPSARRSPDRLPAATRITSTTHDGDDLTAPMPCSIVAVLTEEGAEIAEGDPVVAVEAMKMEQTISAHRDGVVQELKVEAGQSLTRGSLICRISSSGNPG